MKFEVTLTTDGKTEQLYCGCLKKEDEYFFYQENTGFQTKICYSKQAFHLIRKKDYVVEIVIENKNSIVSIDSIEGKLELPIEIIEYQCVDDEVYLKYQLQNQIFIYQIRSLNGRN